jgi:hypothetical protein
MVGMTLYQKYTLTFHRTLWVPIKIMPRIPVIPAIIASKPGDLRAGEISSSGVPVFTTTGFSVICPSGFSDC